MNCSICGTPLTGGLDTYGDAHWPLCFEDYFTPPDDEPATETLFQQQFRLMELEAEVRRAEDAVANQRKLLKLARRRLFAAQQGVSSYGRLLTPRELERIEHWKALVSS